MAVDALTNSPGISTSVRQREAVVPSQGRVSLDRKGGVFHKAVAWAAARRIERDTAGLVSA